MFLSRSAEYAVRGVTRLARQPSGTLLGARGISEAERTPMQVRTPEVGNCRVPRQDYRSRSALRFKAFRPGL